MTADRFSPYVHITRFCAPQRIDAEIPMPRIAAAPCAFSLTTRITQRDGRQGTDSPNSRTRVPGPGRQQEPRTLDEPELAPVPPIVRGLQAARPSRSLSSSLGGIKSIPAGLPAHPRAAARDQLHRRSDGPVRSARRTRMPAPRQSRKTLSAADATFAPKMAMYKYTEQATIQ